RTKRWVVGQGDGWRGGVLGLRCLSRAPLELCLCNIECIVAIFAGWSQNHVDQFFIRELDESFFKVVGHSTVYWVFGIAAPRWHVAHCTFTTSAAGFPIWLPSVLLTSATIFIITRAVFFCCFSSEAASIGICPFAPGAAPAISAWQ